MKKIELKLYEIDLLEKLARRSKMDCWFSVDDEGGVRDRENGNRIMSTNKAVRQLIEGLTPYDIEILDNCDIIFLLGLAVKS